MPSAAKIDLSNLPEDQRDVDTMLIALNGTDNKARLGANALLGLLDDRLRKIDS